MLILSISGLHVGILAFALLFLMRLGVAPRKRAIASVVAIVIFYAFIIEAEPPAVRATVMVLMACGAILNGRQASAYNVLAGAALVVLAINPADLFRIGPQLSFLAAAALAWIGARARAKEPSDPLARLIARTRPWHERAARWFAHCAWRGVLVTICVWLVTLPLVMTRFHLVSPVSILLTPLLSLPIAVGLLAGFGVLVFGWLVPPLGYMCGWVCDRSLAFTDRLVELGSHWPANHFWVLGPPTWWIVATYALLALSLALPHWRPRKNWCLAAVGAWSAVGMLAPTLAARSHAQLTCTALSMGHGCAVVVEMPDGRTLLYDAGRLGSPEGAARSIAAFLWYRGITRVNAVVVSHADVDHYNGLPQLVEQFRIDRVYATARTWNDQTLPVETLRRALESKDVPIATIAAGSPLQLDRTCTLRVLHPPSAGVAGSDNANSIVLELTYRGHTILLPGDLETPGIEQVMAVSHPDVDILLAPHHGSSRSDPPGFAAWSHPRWVIISGSRTADGEHVAETYRRAGAEVLHTETDGAITVHIDEHGVQVERWKKAKP